MKIWLNMALMAKVLVNHKFLSERINGFFGLVGDENVQRLAV